MGNDLAATDLTVFAKDYPEVRLVAEVRSAVSPSPDLDSVVRQLARYMWGSNCHYGLLVTPTTTYVLKDDFTIHGPEAIHVSDVLPTEKLLGRLGARANEVVSEQQLQSAFRDWLALLASSYEAALPDDPDVTKAFFPEIVGAVAEGRVVAEASAR
jgi:hypothetical protein